MPGKFLECLGCWILNVLVKNQARESIRQKTEHYEAKGTKQNKIKIDKKPYGKIPVVLVFKTSNRSNAKIKMKVWRNTNIDYIASADKLPGVPQSAVILECGVGQSCIDSYKLKYNL